MNWRAAAFDDEDSWPDKVRAAGGTAVLDWGMTEWLVAAGLVSGLAALVALFKDGASFFRPRDVPPDPVRVEIERAESRRAEMVKAAGLAVGGVAIAGALHSHRKGGGNRDQGPLDDHGEPDSMAAAADGDAADSVGEAGEWVEHLKDILGP